MGTSNKARLETPPSGVEKNQPLTSKTANLPLSDRIRPWLARPARRQPPGHYTLLDIQKALDLAG